MKFITWFLGCTRCPSITAELEEVCRVDINAVWKAMYEGTSEVTLGGITYELKTNT